MEEWNMCIWWKEGEMGITENDMANRERERRFWNQGMRGRMIKYKKGGV